MKWARTVYNLSYTVSNRRPTGNTLELTFQVLTNMLTFDLTTLSLNPRAPNNAQDMITIFRVKQLHSNSDGSTDDIFHKTNIGVDD